MISGYRIIEGKSGSWILERCENDEWIFYDLYLTFEEARKVLIMYYLDVAKMIVDTNKCYGFRFLNK